MISLPFGFQDSFWTARTALLRLHLVNRVKRLRSRHPRRSFLLGPDPNSDRLIRLLKRRACHPGANAMRQAENCAYAPLIGSAATIWPGSIPETPLPSRSTTPIRSHAGVKGSGGVSG